MAEKQWIILEAIIEGKSQRRIAREMKISRATVARYLKEYQKAKSKLMGDDIKSKKEIIPAPKYASSGRVKIKLTDEIIEKIQSYLAENEEKRAADRSRQ